VRRDAFEHAIRAAAAVLGSGEVLVIGSQALHASVEGPLPPEALRSVEVDVAALKGDPDGKLADLIDGSIGEASGYVRVPGDMVLDVLTSGKTPETQGASRYCAHFVHPSFDQQFARLVDGTSLTYSAARRPLAGTSPALNLLQRTKSSAIDFFRAAPAPPVSVRTAGTATGLRLRDQ